MRNPSRRRPKPITTAHQRQLKQASNRRYYQRQNSKRGDPIQIFPLPLLESEANDIATDIEFQKGDAGRVLRKFGSRALVGYVAADIVREQLKLKKSKARLTESGLDRVMLPSISGFSSPVLREVY